MLEQNQNRVGGPRSMRGGRPLGTRDQKPRQPKMGQRTAGATVGGGGTSIGSRMGQRPLGGVVNKGQDKKMTRMRDKYATKAQGKTDIQRKAIKQRMLGRMQKRGIISGEKGSGRGVFDKARQNQARPGYKTGGEMKQTGASAEQDRLARARRDDDRSLRQRPQGSGSGGQTGVPGGPRRPQKPLGFGGY